MELKLGFIIFTAAFILSYSAFTQERASNSIGVNVGKAGEPAVVHLERRGYRITIHSGANGPLYTVRDKAGKVFATELSAKELQAKLPQIHKLVEGAYAPLAKSGILWGGF